MKTFQVSFRIPLPLLERIDRYLAANNKKWGITRTDAVFALLELALDEIERKRK